MCVIAIKPHNVPLDDAAMNRLKNCWDVNPDGAGIMYRDQGKVAIYKGYMTWRRFKRAIRRHNLRNRGTVVFHFRIATHGAVIPQMCHPFPASSRLDDLLATGIRASMGIAHNGIITSVPKHEYLSDTQVYIQQRLMQIPKRDRLDDMATTGSKFVVMTPTSLTTVGKFEEEAGWFYSNDSFDGWTWNMNWSGGWYRQSFFKAEREETMCLYCGDDTDDLIYMICDICKENPYAKIYGGGV